MGGVQEESTEKIFDPKGLQSTVSGALQLGSRLQSPTSPTSTFYPRSLASPGEISPLGSTQLTPGELRNIEAQFEEIDAGLIGAEQAIQETTRSEATGRGLFSSRGAIAQEASGLARIPLERARLRSGVFGQQAGLERQALESGQQLQLQSQTLRSQADLQARGQDLEFQRLQQGNVQMQNQEELERQRLALQAFLGAGQLAGSTTTESRSQGSGLLGSAVGSIAGGLFGGKRGGA